MDYQWNAPYFKQKLKIIGDQCNRPTYSVDLERLSCSSSEVINQLIHEIAEFITLGQKDDGIEVEDNFDELCFELGVPEEEKQ